MKFVTFGKEHLEEAKRIAWENYLEERVFVPALPEDIKLWDLNYFAKKRIGSGSLESGKTGRIFVLVFSLVGSF